MYVIRNKEGKFYGYEGRFVKSLDRADIYRTLSDARLMLGREKQIGEALYEVNLVLGKKVK